MKKILAILLLTTLVTGCSYKSTVSISPSYDVYSNYDEKLQGHFALYVDAEEMNTTVKVRGHQCSAHKYPLEAEKPFTMSVYKTFENLLESVTLVDHTIDSRSLIQQGYDAMIKVEVEDLDIRLKAIPGFWTAEMEADTEITARMTVHNHEGRKLGTSVEGDGDSLNPIGSACSGGADSIGLATQDAIKETVERLGERIANATKLRNKQVTHK